MNARSRGRLPLSRISALTVLLLDFKVGILLFLEFVSCLYIFVRI